MKAARAVSVVVGAVAAVVAGAIVSAAPLFAAVPGDRAEPRAVLLDERVTVPVPDGYTHELLALGDKGWLLTLDDGRGVLLVTVYAGAKPPSRAAALAAHTEALRRRAASAPARRIRASLLGASRPARELRFDVGGVAHTARVVAARRARETVVALWSWPDADLGRRAALDGLVARISGPQGPGRGSPTR